ncbi:nuclear transport factor 2 family protein [Candidatus Zixiibacteriota bacterium]
MEQLFSQDNILVLGTQPREILTSYERAQFLVSSDWRRWGDCTFLMDNAHISTSGKVAWISTVGYVEFDMSRFLVLPLRLSAVMVKEAELWKFQQMQFQFDVDITSLLVTIILLLIWLPISLISLTVVTVRSVRRRRKGDDFGDASEHSPMTIAP